MSTEDDRIATEKLLEVIRGKRSSGEDNPSEESRSILASEMERGRTAESPMRGSIRPILGEMPSQQTASPESALQEEKEEIQSSPLVSPSAFRKRPWLTFKVGLEKTVLGLDIGFHSIKYVLQKQTVDGPVLQDFGMKRLPVLSEDSLARQEDIIAGAIRQLIKDRRIQAGRVMVSVSGPQVVIRRMPIPKVPSRELRESIFWAVRKDIPFPTEHFLFDYHIMDDAVAGDVRKIDTLVAAVEIPLVDRICRIMKKSGVRLDGITVAPMALWNLQRAIGIASGQQPAVLLDIGHRAMTFAFFHSGKLVFTREVFTAGQSLATSIAEHANSEPAVSRGREMPPRTELSRVVALFPPGKSHEGFEASYKSMSLDSQSSALGRLINEINRSLDYCQSRYPEAPLEPVYISGGVACTEGFDRLLADSLGLDVRRLNPFSCIRPEAAFGVSSLSEDVLAAYGIAVGLALYDGQGINLMPKEKRSRIEIALDHIVVPVGVATVTVALLMAALLGYYTAKAKTTLKTVEEIQANQQNLAKLELAETKRLMGQEEQLAHNRRVLSYINYRTPRATAVMKDLSLITPAEIILDSVVIDKKKNHASPVTSSSQDGHSLFLEIKGAVFGNPGMQGSVLTRFLLALDESPFFKFPRIMNQSAKGDEGAARLNFGLECQMDVDLR